MTMPVGPHQDLLTEKLAIDCEMMQSNIGPVLGRVSLINYECQTVYDTYVCYPPSIDITNTSQQFSGINEADISPQNGAQLFSEVQSLLLELLRGRNVIGHDIQRDLSAISTDLSSHFLRVAGKPAVFTKVSLDIRRRDVQKCRRFQQYALKDAKQGPNLKKLAQSVLGRQIKQGQVSSVEDAVAIMELYRKMEEEIEKEQGNK